MSIFRKATHSRDGLPLVCDCGDILEGLCARYVVGVVANKAEGTEMPVCQEHLRQMHDEILDALGGQQNG